MYTESRTYTQVLDSSGGIVLDNPVSQRQALRTNAANNVTDMMVGSANGGTSSSANFYTQEIAGKTGSSGGNDDRWFIGMTPYYVAAVWTGYDIRPAASTGRTPPASPGGTSCRRSTRGSNTARSPIPQHRRRYDDFRRPHRAHALSDARAHRDPRGSGGHGARRHRAADDPEDWAA